MVEKVKDDREVSLEFMKSYEREMCIFEQGVKEERERSEAAIKNADKRADDEAKRADDETKRADDEAKRADDATERADNEAKRADDATKRAEEAKKALNKNFIEMVENVAKNFQISIQEACEKSGRSYEEYLEITNNL
jgi:membrane protein involved in colicin uptake